MRDWKRRLPKGQTVERRAPGGGHSVATQWVTIGANERHPDGVVSERLVHEITGAPQRRTRSETARMGILSNGTRDPGVEVGCEARLPDGCNLAP